MPADMSNLNSRALVSAAAIGGGALLAVAAPSIGLAAAGGVALTSVFGSVYAADLREVWVQRKDDPRYKHPNDDLTRLIGEAIASTLYRCAEDTRLTDTVAKNWCKKLAKKAARLWTNLAPAPSLTAVDEQRLPDLFAAAAENRNLPLLSQKEWRDILDNLRDAARIKGNDAAMTFAAQRLHKDLFREIRERFKIDFADDGRAYAALTLDMSSRILAGVNQLDADQRAALQELPGRLSALVDHKN